VSDLDEGHYSVQLVNGGISRNAKSGYSDITILVKNLEVMDASSHEWFGGYSLVKANRFTVRSLRRPVIEYDPDFSLQEIDLLRSEGFAVEGFEATAKFATLTRKAVTRLHDPYRDAGQSFNEVSYINEIDESGMPLVRIWRWPHGCRSALAITGDVDSITITDFARRFFEVRNEHAA
jgi:hypothetical protein